MDKPQNHYAKWRRQTQEITYCVVLFIQNVQQRKIYRDRKKITGCLGWRLRGTGLTVNEHEGPYWDEGECS